MRDNYEGGFNRCALSNSPWAAIDGYYGLELVGRLSHIAQLSDSGEFPYRFYTHAPWWLNRPWFERYGGYPHDIYLPLALARHDENGYVTKPTFINFLTGDTSRGEVPDRCPLEVVPHLVRALDNFPDALGLVTWVYPFDEYHNMVAQNKLAEPFFGDWCVTGAVDHGLPFSGVVSTRSFARCHETFTCSVLLCLMPDTGSPLERALLDVLAGGGR